jgi:hypothetical protein
MSIEEALQARARELLGRGKRHAAAIGRYEGRPAYWYQDDDVAEVRAWFDSVFNLFRLITTPDMHFYAQVQAVSKHQDLAREAPFWAVQQLIGSLNSIIEEIELGLVTKAEYLFTATAFDDFLDHGEHFHKGGKKIESSILASIVFEDSLRKIAQKTNVNHTGKNIEELIDELTKAGVWNAVAAKRIKSYSAVRNQALHAQWDKFELRDVGELIKGTRDLIGDYLV